MEPSPIQGEPLWLTAYLFFEDHGRRRVELTPGYARRIHVRASPFRCRATRPAVPE